MDLIGRTLGQYHIVEAIGHGGMATVFRARQPALERDVAVKVLLPHQAGTPEFRERFVREAKAIAQLNHPNILPVIDYGQADDLIYIVMKYVPGGTLAERLKRPIDLATTTHLISQIAAALDHAHQRGIIHRDVKPSNVLLDENEWVQLADFGLAKLLEGDQALTSSGLSMGTPAYLSPEQGQGEPIDQRADIYSLGVMVYEMVTGRLPFTAETPMGVIIKHIYDQPLPPRTLNPALPEALESVVLKGLAKPIEQRYHSAGELARALQQAVLAAPSITLSPVIGIDSNATPLYSPQQIPPAPITVSSKLLFEETVPAVPHFIGRETELDTYSARLDRDRFVLITGMAGMGKTTLGARLARQATLADDIFWFTFDHVEKSTAEALYWAIAAFLENRGEGSLARYLRGEVGAQKPLERMARLNLLITALANGNYVLCFDDFQIAADTPEVAYFFTQIRQRFVELRQPLPARFIIMGRTVTADMEHLVPEALHGLSLEATRQFLIDRGVTLTTEHLQQLWQHTEGNPKLLELSAGALRDLTGEAAGNFISGLLRRGDIRDYVLHNIYQALTPAEQKVMGALSVFPGPIDRSGVEELLSDDDLGPVAHLLDALAHKHVLELTADDQIDCHDLVRDYCYHILSRRERDLFHERAAVYFTQEHDWLATGYHHFQRRAIDAALEALIPHQEAIINQGQAAALSELLARFNTATLTAAQRVQLHQVQGDVFRIRGEYQQAQEALQAALGEALTDEVKASILQMLGLTNINRGEYAQAISYLQRSLVIYETNGNKVELAKVHHYIGANHMRQGQFDAANQHYRISEAIARQIGDRRLLADANIGVGLVLWHRHSLDEAQARLEESRRIYREYKDRFGEANALDNLANISGERGDLSQCIAYHQQALQIDLEIGNVYGRCVSLNNLAHAYYLSADYSAAYRYYDELVQLSNTIHQITMLSLACAGLADTALKLQQPEKALELAQLAEQYARQVGAPLYLGVAARVLGDVWLALQKLGRAREYYEQSIPLLTKAEEANEVRLAEIGLAQVSHLLAN